ncbi:xanthine dehydrogenase accessory factor [uncultured Gammaproteobacteria bacterium]
MITPPTRLADMVLDTAAAWRDQGREVALATVIATWGSSPCPAGSQMAIAGDGAMAGSVSGGCIEAAVVEQAQQVLTDGEPRLLRFGVSSEQAWEVGLTCGGRIELYLERID